LAQVWLAVGGTLVLLALLEGGARLVVAARPRPVDPRVQADAYPAEPWVAELYDEHARSARMRWESYVYWRRLPFVGRYINVDEHGLRRTWQPTTVPPRRLFFFGGSAAWGTGVRDDQTIASQLARYLAAAGAPVQVVNFGETGYVSTQLVITLLRQLQMGSVPDVVVMYMGGTDVASAQLNGEAGLPNNESHRVREFNLLHHARRLMPEALRVAAARSALFQLCGFRGGAEAGLRTAPTPAPRVAEALEREVEANLRAVEALGASYHFGCLFVWEPSIFFKRRLTAYEAGWAARFAGTRSWFRDVDERVRRDWAARADVLYLGDLFAAEAAPRFIDQSHPGEVGDGEIAAAIGRVLVARRKPQG
jgi:lysophospholipase L1-like esterase